MIRIHTERVIIQRKLQNTANWIASPWRINSHSACTNLSSIGDLEALSGSENTSCCVGWLASINRFSWNAWRRMLIPQSGKFLDTCAVLYRANDGEAYLPNDYSFLRSRNAHSKFRGLLLNAFHSVCTLTVLDALLASADVTSVFRSYLRGKGLRTLSFLLYSRLAHVSCPLLNTTGHTASRLTIMSITVWKQRVNKKTSLTDKHRVRWIVLLAPLDEL